MNRVKELKKIMEKSGTDKIVVLTNRYQITGYVYDCEECNKEYFINLTNASLCKISDVYESQCDNYSSLSYDWLHINLDKAVAFSFIK